MLRAVFFDFDGVIFQTEVYRMEHLEVKLRELGVKTNRQELYELIGGDGNRTEKMERFWGEQSHYKAHRQEILFYRPPEFHYPTLLTPGIRETLDELFRSEIKLAIVSNSNRQLISDALHECNLTLYFQEIFSGSDMGIRKPNGTVYFEALKSFGLKEAECLIVEDSSVGISAGKSAGISVAALKDQDGMIDQSQADYILNDPSELLKLPIVSKCLRSKKQNEAL